MSQETKGVVGVVNLSVPIVLNTTHLADFLVVELLKDRPGDEVGLREYLVGLCSLGARINQASSEKENENGYQYAVASSISTYSTRALQALERGDAEIVGCAMRELMEIFIRGFENRQRSVSNRPRSPVKEAAKEIYISLRRDQRKVTSNDLISALLIAGHDQIKQKTVQNWLSDFRKIPDSRI